MITNNQNTIAEHVAATRGGAALRLAASTDGEPETSHLSKPLPSPADAMKAIVEGLDGQADRIAHVANLIVALRQEFRGNVDEPDHAPGVFPETLLGRMHKIEDELSRLERVVFEFGA